VLLGGGHFVTMTSSFSRRLLQQQQQQTPPYPSAAASSCRPASKPAVGVTSFAGHQSAAAWDEHQQQSRAQQRDADWTTQHGLAVGHVGGGGGGHLQQLELGNGRYDDVRTSPDDASTPAPDDWSAPRLRAGFKWGQGTRAFYQTAILIPTII